MSKISNERSIEELNKDISSLKRSRTFTYICMIILFILLLVLLSLRCTCPKPSKDSVIEEGNIDIPTFKTSQELQDEVDKAVSDGMFNVFMNTNVIFEDGSTKGNLLIQNTKTNNNQVVVEIYLNDTNELIYKSDKIPVGYKIEKDVLLKDLDKGKYKCTAYFNAIDNNIDRVVNKIPLSIDITIEND